MKSIKVRGFARNINLQKYIFLIILITILAAPAFTDVQVDYTNQFFVSETDAGQCYVFIYEDNFTFVSKNGRELTKIKLLYNAEGIDNTFITGNVFCLKRRERLYCYDLNILLKPENEGKRIDNCRAQIEQIDRISTLSLYKNTVYYTKNNDTVVYEYSPDRGIKKDTPIPNIRVNSKQYPLKYVLHRPITENRVNEYLQKKKKIENIITVYNDIETVEKENIEVIITTSQPDLNPSQPKITIPQPGIIIGKTTNGLSGKYAFDEDLFKSFWELAQLTGKNSEADGMINRIKRNGANLQIDTISKFYSAHKELTELNKRETLKGIQDTINKKIDKAAEDLKFQWGDNYEEKKTDFADLEKVYKRNDHKWNQNEAQFNTNNGKIGLFDGKLDSLLNNSKYKNDGEYKEYKEYLEILGAYNFISDGYNKVQNENGYTDDNVAKVINTMGLAVNDYQIKLFEIINNKFKTDYEGLTTLESELAEAPKNLDDKIKKVKEKKDDYIEKIAAAAAVAYRKTIYDKVYDAKKKVTLNRYNSDYANYCIISDADRRIFGFEINDNIEMSDFGDNKNSAGEDYRFIRPSGYPLISSTENAVFILTSKKTISAFDRSRPNIIENRITPLNIDDGVFYMVNSDNSKYQYVVTKNGHILKLSIDGQTIKRENVGQAGGNDTILVTGDNCYILSPDAHVNNSANMTIRVKAANSENIFNIVLRDKHYIIR
jgi:hypothetical protein